MRSPNFHILATSDQAILLQDDGPWDRFPTITNGAERVVATLHRDNDLGERRLFYLDSEDELTELLHVGSRLRGFGFVTLSDLLAVGILWEPQS
jgi:hypothetical protein